MVVQPVTLLSPLPPSEKGANPLWQAVLSPCHPFYEKILYAYTKVEYNTWLADSLWWSVVVCHGRCRSSEKINKHNKGLPDKQKRIGGTGSWFFSAHVHQDGMREGRRSGTTQSGMLQCYMLHVTFYYFSAFSGRGEENEMLLYNLYYYIYIIIYI